MPEASFHPALSEERRKTLSRLSEQVLRHQPASGESSTAVPGLELTRYDDISAPRSCNCRTVFALVVSGAKEAHLGNASVSFRAGDLLFFGIHLPDFYTLAEASPEKPFLCAALSIEPDIISSVTARLRETRPLQVRGFHAAGPAFQILRADERLLDAYSRLVGLLDAPENIPFMAPLVKQEICYYILSRPESAHFQWFINPTSTVNRIREAAHWIQRHFREKFSVADVASFIGMSQATFYRYFREVTNMTPRQYVKELRLYEARRLILEEGVDALRASARVGYESPAYFSREFKALFGSSPGHYPAGETEKKR